MIPLSCPTCGKQYSFSDRFVGRKLVCTVCKTHLIVPDVHSVDCEQTNESESLASSSTIFSVPVPPPLPDSAKQHHVVSPLASLPSPPPPPKTEPAVLLDETTDILAHVYQEKHLDVVRQTEERSPNDLSSSSGGFQLPESDSWKPLRFWASIVSVLILIIGVSIYFALYADFSGPDPRPEMLRQLEQKAAESLANARQKDTETGTFRLCSLEDWNKGSEVQDVFVLAQNERDHKRNDLVAIQKVLSNNVFSDVRKNEIQAKQKEIAESIAASENRISRLREQLNEYRQNAIKHEAASALALQDAIFFQSESDFYSDKVRRLQQEISDYPQSREPVPTAEFAMERKRSFLDAPVQLDRDWTENPFASFDLPSLEGTNEMISFEGNRRLDGNKSLRFCFFEKTQAKFVLPKNRTAHCVLPQARFLSFAIRFPEMLSPLLGEGVVDSGKLAEIKIRFVNPTGYVELTTVSTAYLETVFYDARGKFAWIEFPLEGNDYWIRDNHFDRKRLNTELADDFFAELDAPKTEPLPTDESKEAPESIDIGSKNSETSFFERIDWVEFQIVPLTNRAICWIDGIALTEKQARPAFDMQEMQSAQREQREEERAWHVRRQEEIAKPIRDWIASLTVDRVNEKTTETEKNRNAKQDASPENVIEYSASIQKEHSPTENEQEFEGAKEERIRKLFRRILQDAKGKIRAKQYGQILTFGSKSNIPENLDGLELEEIDLTLFRRLDDEMLDLIGEQANLKSLCLARTNLDDRKIIKIASLVSLEVLDLSGNQLTFEAFNSIRALKKLRELNVSGIRSNVDGLDALGGLTELRKLVLNRSGIDGIDLNYLLPLADLEELDISSTKIGDRGLATIRTFTKLQTLNLSRTRISNSGLLSLNNLRQLKRLALDGTNLDNSCLRMLKNFSSLEHVSVLNTKITKDGVLLELGSNWLDRFQLSNMQAP